MSSIEQPRPGEPPYYQLSPGNIDDTQAGAEFLIHEFFAHEFLTRAFLTRAIRQFQGRVS